MVFIDANAILRYILCDDADMAYKVRELIAKTKVTVRYEVLSEVVYVMNKVYSIPRSELADYIKTFLRLSNVETESEEVLSLALKAYAELNMDIVDCMLYGFRAIEGHDVFTFDKKLNSVINKLA